MDSFWKGYFAGVGFACGALTIFGILSVMLR